MPPVIPKPNKVELREGTFVPAPGIGIRYDTRAKTAAEDLAKALSEQFGFPVKTLREELRTGLRQEIYLNWADSPMRPESYILRVTPKRMDLEAYDEAGMFYATQTLLQSLPIEGEAQVPCMTVRDVPRFVWRGMHLDVGRHYFPVEDIKGFLRWMAFHKLNVFHWHLTEDQGWRLEIKQYPKLTEVGSKRASTPPYGDRLGSDNTPYGGFYTQEEVREVVAYAAKLHIEVVPEIDMPGHMLAAIAAYPELGNTDIPDYAPEVSTRWGVHPYTLSPKEETFTWVENVLGEVCDLFPSKYIHVGGDEAPKGQWEASPFAQSVMVREGLEDENALQSYFLQRVSKMLEKHDRKMLGWDEIREGGLADGATVMVWRSHHHAIEAAEQGHDVVMAPTSHTYFDYYQADPKSELAKGKEFECIGGHLNLEKVYSFDPVSEKLKGTPNEHRIMGTQGQLWSEYIKTWDKAEYLAFPRMAALSEVAWTEPDQRDWKEFQVRLKPILQRYKQAGVRYFDPFAE